MNDKSRFTIVINGAYENGSVSIYQLEKKHWKIRKSWRIHYPKYDRHKELTREEQPKYQVELLKRKLMKKEKKVVQIKKSMELNRQKIIL